MTTRSLHVAIVLLSAAVALLSISVARIAVRPERAPSRHHARDHRTPLGPLTTR